MFKSLVYNIGSKALVILSQFVALIITNHIIGAEGRGIFLAAITWSSTFFILTHCSLATGILNLSHKRVENIYDLAYLAAIAAFILGIASILLSFLVYDIHPALFNNLNLKYVGVAFGAIPFMMLQQFSMAIVQVKGNFKAFNVLYASYSILNLAGIIVVWLLHKTSVDLLIWINLGAWLLTGIIALYFMWPFIKKKSDSNSILRLLIKTSLAAHFGAIVTFVVSRSDILIVNYFSTEKQTGVYGLAVGIVQMLLIIPLSMQNLLYHNLIGKPVIEQKTILLQYSRVTFAVMFICAAGIMILSRPLVYIIGGKSFEEAIPLFKYFLPAIVFYSMPMVLATQWNIMGIFKQVNVTSVFVLIISIVSNIVLVPLIGISGGAITFLIIAILAFLIHVWFVKRNLGDTALLEIILINAADIKSILKMKKNVV
ncbi:MAG: hypothetical protein ABIT07_06345 [Ferruginibacter sp.]